MSLISILPILGNEAEDDTTQPSSLTVKDQAIVHLAPLSFVCANEYDSLGSKTGYWCEYDVNIGLLKFVFYKGGKANGLARYYRNNQFGEYYLFSIGQYEEGQEIGQWQFFYPDGKLWLIADSCSKNERFKDEAKKFGQYNPATTRQSYTIAYDTLGNKSEEGWWIYDGDILIDGDQVGLYKLYNKDGSVTIKDYGN